MKKGDNDDEESGTSTHKKNGSDEEDANISDEGDKNSGEYEVFYNQTEIRHIQR